MNRALLFLGALGLLIPSAGWAANGSPCNYTGDPVQFTATRSGTVRTTSCAILVDNVTSASGGPIVFDLRNWAVAGGSATPSAGMPDQLRFAVGGDNDCTAGTVTLTHSNTSGGPANNFVAGSATTLDVDTSSPAGATDVAINIYNGRPIGPFINVSWSAVAGCTGGFDILAIGHEVTR